jgi:hypothetical protein
VTSLIGGWRIRVRDRWTLPLGWLPPLFNAVWEIVQGLGWTGGRMDFWDGVVGVAGWLLAEVMFFRSKQPGVEISRWLNWRVAVVITGFACMGCAAVWR